MRAGLFATAVMAFLCVQGWFLGQLLHGWAGVFGLPLGMLEGWLLWSWVAKVSPVEMLRKLAARKRPDAIEDTERLYESAVSPGEEERLRWAAEGRHWHGPMTPGCNDCRVIGERCGKCEARANACSLCGRPGWTGPCGGTGCPR